jgi:flagellar motor switch protein FliM
MAAPLIDRMLARFEEALRPTKESAWAEGYRFGAMVEDVRGLELALDAHEFHLFRMQLDIGGGAKSGRMVLVLPDRARPVPDEAEVQETEAEPGCGSAVLAAPVDMTAVLARISLPFDELQALQPGQVLTLAGDALHQAVLEVAQGHRVAEVTLGQLNGFRAVRLGSAGGQLGRSETLEALPEPPISATVVEHGEADIVGDLPALPARAAPQIAGEDTTVLADRANEAVEQELEGLPDLDDLTDFDDLPDLADLPLSGDGPVVDSEMPDA